MLLQGGFLGKAWMYTIKSNKFTVYMCEGSLGMYSVIQHKLTCESTFPALLYLS